VNRRLASQIMNTLRPAGPAESEIADLPSWNRRHWLETLPWLHASGLALPVLRVLRERGQEDLLPPDVRARLERNQADNRQRVLRMAEEFAALNRCFENAGVRYAALKGFALIPDYTPDASLRAPADFDYLLAPESLSRAEQALREASYIRQGRDEGGTTVFFHSARPLRIPASDDELYSPALPRRLELHTSLWNPDPEAIRALSLEAALERARLRDEQGLCFPALADEDALIFQVLHALRHIFDFWCRLSTLHEIAWFLERRARDETFWARIVARAEDEPGLPAAAGVVFTLVSKVFGASLPTAIADWVRGKTPRAMALWVERYGRECALENFMGNKLSLLLRREFIPDAAAWRAAARKRLLPFHRPNRATQAASPRISSRLTAAMKQSLHVARRAKFHLAAGLRYAWELPRWHWALREISRTVDSHGAEKPAPLPPAVPRGIIEDGNV
jgi:hypothetical protein